MSLALSPSDDLASAVRRVAAERAATAMDALRSGTAHPAGDVDVDGEDAWDEGVHDARKRCKEIRGLARLCREPLGSAYSEINTAFRDAARILSPARDAWTLVETAGRLAAGGQEEPEDGADRGAALTLRSALVDRYRQVRREVADAGGLGAALHALEQATAAISSWPLPPDLSPADLRPGIIRTYGRARARWLDVAGTVDEDPQPSTEAWHEWRKRVKYTWYQVQLLEPAWPGPLGALEDEWDDLSDLLGEDHDLGVLVAALRDGGLVDPAAVEPLVTAAAAPRHGLRAKAAALAPLVMAEEAEPFADRLVAYAATVPRWA